VVWPLKAARCKALEEMYCRLNENRSATEADNMLQSPAEIPNNNPMDLDEGHINVEDPWPSQDTPKNKQDTHGEAQRLYNTWRKLILTRKVGSDFLQLFLVLWAI
jgi:hypothetical protein